MVRRAAYYTGRVQGVGFRYTTQRIAADYPVDGFVKNLPDGRVELVAEGPPAQVQAFLAAVAIEDTEARDTAGQVSSGDVCVLLRLAPPLHARGTPSAHGARAVLRIFRRVRCSKVRSHLFVQ